MMMRAKPNVTAKPLELLNELTRRSGVVDRIGRGQNRARDLFQRLERLAGDHAWRGHAGNRHRIDLLEMIERLGNDGGFELGDGRKRRQGAVRRLDVIIQDLIRVQSKPLGDLRNDFV